MSYLNYCTEPDGKYTYKPYVRDFCETCLNCRRLLLYGDGGTMRCPEPYSYHGYVCKAQGPRLIFIGDGHTSGYPEGCPELEIKLKKILSKHLVDVANYIEYLKERESKKCSQCGHIPW
jgi:hypothetical protein